MSASCLALRRSVVLLAAVLVTMSAILGTAPSQAANAASHARPDDTSGALGSPDFVGWAVYDLDAVSRQFAAATGTQFRATRASTYPVVVLDADGSQHSPREITVESAFSERGAPFFEIMHASAAVGPWAATTTQSTPVLGYAVDDVWQSSASLFRAHMALVAYSGRSFAYFEGVDGILIELVDKSLVPMQSEVNESQAPIDFGPTLHVDYAVCDREAVKAQLTTALGFGWQAPVTLNPTFNFTPGGTFPGRALVDFSLATNPGIELETNKPSIGPFACNATYSSFHPGWRAEPGVGPWQQQLIAAGERHMADVDNGVFWDEGLGGIQLEVFDPTLG